MSNTIIKLSDPVKELLTLMSFPPIPEEANFIAFTGDGEATFLTEFNAGLTFPKMVIVNYYDVPELKIE